MPAFLVLRERHRMRGIKQGFHLVDFLTPALSRWERG